MKRPRVTRRVAGRAFGWGALAAVAVAVSLMTVVGPTAPGDGARRAPPPERGRLVSGITGLEQAMHRADGTVLRRVRADEIRMAPARVGIFEVGLMPQIHVRNARVEEYLTAAGADDGLHLVDALAVAMDLRLPAPTGRGAVTILGRAAAPVIVSPIRLTVFRDGAPLLELRADRAAYAADDSATFYDAVIVETGSGTTRRRVESQRIDWDASARRFDVAGRFDASSTKGRASGEGISVDLDFRVSPLMPAVRRATVSPAAVRGPGGHG